MVAFNIIFNNHWDQLYQSAYKVLLDEDLAKDVIQEVFLDLWIRRNELMISNLGGYLYKATRYQCLRQLHRNKSMERLEERFITLAANTTEEQLNLEDLRGKLNKSLGQMSDKERKIFEMSRFENRSNQEIAHELNLSQRTVEWYLYRIVKNLKASFSLVFVLTTNFFN